MKNEHPLDVALQELLDAGDDDFEEAEKLFFEKVDRYNPNGEAVGYLESIRDEVRLQFPADDLFDRFSEFRENKKKRISIDDSDRKSVVSSLKNQNAQAEKKRKDREATTPASDEVNPEAMEASSLTDLGNARRLAEQNRDVIKFSYALNQWFCWNGVFWEPDAGEGIERLAKQTARKIFSEASSVTDKTEQQAIVRHAFRSQSREKLRAMVDLARSEIEITIKAESLDQHPMLLAVKNGVVDLLTGKLMTSNPGLLLTKCSPVEYVADAKCPRWLQFLDEIFLGDRELIGFVQKLAGYLLSGDVSERIIGILHGPGRNGKSVFIFILKNLLGPGLARNISPKTITKSKWGEGDGKRNDIAALRGYRLATIVETAEGDRLNEELVKAMAGGVDDVSCRLLYKEWTDLRPQFKVLLVTNHRPRVTGTDPAIWDRIRLIPFAYRVPEEKINPFLPELLKGELPGILNWGIQGCLRWQQEKLGHVEAVDKAGSEYQAEENPVRRFLDENCELAPEFSIQSKTLYEKYHKLAIDSGEHPLSNRRFSERLQALGFKKTRREIGFFFQGIGLGYESEAKNA